METLTQEVKKKKKKNQKEPKRKTFSFSLLFFGTRRMDIVVDFINGAIPRLSGGGNVFYIRKILNRTSLMDGELTQWIWMEGEITLCNIIRAFYHKTGGCCAISGHLSLFIVFHKFFFF